MTAWLSLVLVALGAGMVCTGYWIDVLRDQVDNLRDVADKTLVALRASVDETEQLRKRVAENQTFIDGTFDNMAGWMEATQARLDRIDR